MGIGVQWSPKYSVRDRTIDGEHRRLFDLANEVFSLIDAPNPSERLKAAVLELFRYMEYHFAHEEELMTQVGFEGFQQHVVQHKQIIAEMHGLVTLCSDLQELYSKLRHLMLDWVLGHIVGEDRKIGDSVARAVAARQ